MSTLVMDFSLGNLLLKSTKKIDFQLNMQRYLLLTAALFFTTSASAQAILGQNRAGKYFLRSAFNHEQISELVFDKATLVHNVDTLVRVEQNGRVGLISATGRIVVPLEFDQVIDAVQTGLNVGYVGAKKGTVFSLWNVHSGKKNIEGPFEYARAIWLDLIAARKIGSEILVFYNEKGEKMFDLPGLTVWPGFDNATFSVLSKGSGPGDFYFKNGKPVFNEKFKNGEWTDGTLVLLVERTAKQDVVGSALVTVAGDTLLPLDSVYIRHDCYQRFFVETIKRPQKMGLFDAANGSWIFPMMEQKIMKTGPAGDSTGAIFTRRKAKPEGQFLFDASGKLLAEGISTSILRPVRAFADLFKGEHFPERYFVAVKNATETGLFANDGRIVVPIQYSKIEYAAETHPVIVEKSLRYGDPNPVFNAYDLKTGQKLFASDYQELLFTTSPHRFIARKKDLYGILEVGKEAEARFEFDGLTAFCKPPMAVFSHFLFWARKGDKYFIIGADGTLDVRLVFDDLYLPNPGDLHFEKFKAINRSDARLVALGRRREQPKGYFYIDERGGQTFIADPTMGEMPPLSSDGFVESVVVEEPPQAVAERSNGLPPLVEKPFDVVVSKMPVFPGGDEALLRFYKKKLRYPAKAREKRIQGNVFVEAWIETDGSIRTSKILTDIGGGCGDEAIRLIHSMPKWQPALLNDRALRLKVKLLVPFVLD